MFKYATQNCNGQRGISEWQSMAVSDDTDFPKRFDIDIEHPCAQVRCPRTQVQSPFSWTDSGAKLLDQAVETRIKSKRIGWDDGTRTRLSSDTGYEGHADASLN